MGLRRFTSHTGERLSPMFAWPILIFLAMMMLVSECMARAGNGHSGGRQDFSVPWLVQVGSKFVCRQDREHAVGVKRFFSMEECEKYLSQPSAKQPKKTVKIASIPRPQLKKVAEKQTDYPRTSRQPKSARAARRAPSDKPKAEMTRGANADVGLGPKPETKNLESTPEIKPESMAGIKPEPSPEVRQESNNADSSDLRIAKDAALEVLRQAALPLPATTSERLRTAIEATAAGLAEALKEASVTVIRARTELLGRLLEEVGKPQMLPPSIQVSSARSAVAGQIADLGDQSHETLAPPQKRIALVIGNSAYNNTNELANPRNDAKLMSTALAALGFEVIEGENLDKTGMDDKVREFALKQNDADVSLFYYAGHGMQVAGKNYLLPVDAKLKDPTAIDYETVQLDSILGYMAAPKKVAIALLDACRDNPLAHRFASVVGASRSGAIGQGLAMPTALGGGLLIGFATAPGEVALDGTGKNSPFTAALVKYLPLRGLEIQQLMTEVKADVYEATHGQQSPWHNSDLREAFYLNP